MRNWSLRLRLTLFISLVLVLAGVITTSVTYIELRHSLDRLFDSQQLLFAKRLAALNVHRQPTWPEIEQRNINAKELHLDYDDDALAFAIFNQRGEMLLNDGEAGQQFSFDGGFFTSQDQANISIHGDWRILWLLSNDKRSIIAVGQQLEYQQEILSELLKKQLKPWFFTLIIVLIFIIIMIGYEFAPIKQLTQKISLRKPDDASPITAKRIPKEIEPFVTALNQLFAQIAQTITRERQFISDAAHELRTPLAALKVQTEVVQLSDDDPADRKRALEKMMQGIHRATHLVDQLLTLSRLDSIQIQNEKQLLSWPQLIHSVIDELQLLAEQKTITIEVQELALPNIIGHPLLLRILLRNLINNAIRYIPVGSTITLILRANTLNIEDNGPGVSDTTLARLSERFYRPAGQKEEGSGLGLSIVKQIALLHQMDVKFSNRPQGGFMATLRF